MSLFKLSQSASRRQLFSGTRWTSSTTNIAQQLRDDRRELLDFFPNVLKDIEKASRFVSIPEESEWLTKTISYNVPHGKLARSCTALNACRHLVPGQVSHLSKYLAWSVEMLQGAYIIVDDMCDNSLQRRGVPCWHTLAHIGNKAITDAFLIYMSIPQLLQRHFSSHPCYVELMLLFLNTTFRSMLGQNYDIHAGSKNDLHIDHFNFKRYQAQANYKTSYYSIHVPIAAAMYLANISDLRHHEEVWSISSDLGLLCSVQDDYLDCFENVDQTGKSSTDIRNGKCTWLAVEAVRRASSKQRTQLVENYGIDNESNVEVVQDLYRQLGIRRAALDYLTDSYQRISRRIDRQSSVPAPVLRYPLQCVKGMGVIMR